MKKIFLITEYIDANQNTTGYLFNKLYLNLKKQYGSNLKLIIKQDVNTSYDDAIIVSDVNLNKKILFQRLLFELIISFKFLWKILFHVSKNDLVFTGTTPIFLLPVVFLTKKIKGFQWVLLVHDVFPENLLSANIFKSKNIFYKVLKYLFDKFYSASDQRIVIGHDMKVLIDNKTHKNDSVIIQNWIDENDIQVTAKKDNTILNELGWEQSEEPVFQFFGNIGRVQGIQNIVDALERINPLSRPKVVFIGGGAYEEQLQSSLGQLNDNNIKYVGPIPQNMKSEGLSACDIAIVTLAQGMFGLGVPSKAYFSMAADKPILAIMDEDSEVAYMVKKHQIGWVVPAGNVEALSDALLEISNQYQQMPKVSSRDILIQYYSEPVAMKKIVDVINKTLSLREE